MPCPRNNFGEPTCYITSHPDRPQEKFCATCNKQFVERSSFEFGEIILWVMMALGVLFLL
jgi:hypothetical protein